jgi:alanyl-tRNA synthetase
MKHELELDRRLLKSASKDILSNAEPEDVNGCPVLAVVVPGGDRNALAEAAESIKSKGGVAALVSVGETLSVVLASGNKAVDCKAILGDCLKAFGGRGGGKPDFSQGGVPDASIAGDVITALKEAVSKALI